MLRHAGFTSRLVDEMKNRHMNLSMCILVFIIAMMLSATFFVNVHADNMSFGEVYVSLYIINLENVTCHGVNNITQAVQGALDAARANYTTFLVDFMSSTYGDLDLNLDKSVIYNWAEYENLVETGSNCIIINAHGETLPVPAGYTKEIWITKIAEALAYRNVTWVHTGLYPFYYAYGQSSGESIWEEDGFKRFMSFIGKDNVTCWPTSPNTEHDVKGMSEYAMDMLSFTWPIDDVRYAEFGRPLHNSDFNEDIILPIWHAGNDIPGAVIKFARNDSDNFGFYVHIGTNVTYRNNQPSRVETTNEDYARGYMGAVAAVWSVSYRSASETAILNAEKSLAEASSEGRTNGFDSANQYWQQADQSFSQNNYRSALVNAKLAISAADAATKPESNPTQQYILPLVVVISVGAAGMGFGLRRKRNRKKGV
jgi:hypothetical protein